MPPANARKSGIANGLSRAAFATNRNMSTGRPVRKARRTYEGSPFVDSAIAVSDDDDNHDSDSSTSSVSRPRKRKRSPSPPASPRSDVDNIVSDLGSDTDTNNLSSITQTDTQIVINNMVINVPPGHTGPLILQLDIPAQASTRSITTSDKIERSQRKSSLLDDTSMPDKQHRAGFLDLPAELRNEIYRMVFVSPSCFNFDTPSNFQRSAAFLRTCKQVYDEGRSILYSENHFLLVRKTRRHGSYWEQEWNEVGFKAVRKFLKLIGPANIALLRDVTLHLEDATPCLNPGLATADARRFVFDEVLMSVLKTLAQFAKLRKLDLHFRGKLARDIM